MTVTDPPSQLSTFVVEALATSETTASATACEEETARTEMVKV